MGAAIAAVIAMTLSGTASARVTGAAAATASCKSPVKIGVAYPATGPAASLGAPQWNWAQKAAQKWNASHTPKIQLVPGDTVLAGPSPQALQVAHAFAGNNQIMAVSGPAGSQEQQDTASIWKNAGLAPISGSSTRVQLTRAFAGKARETTKGYFFRTVPNDYQQGGQDAAFMKNVLHVTKVLIIDDSEAYSTGLRDQAKAALKAKGVTVITNHIQQSDTNFSSVINAIPGGVSLIFIPWQVASQAQNFYTQLKNKGKNIPLFGADGTWDPSTFVGQGSYVSGFPVDTSNPTVVSFKNAHSGQPQLFGVPTYTSVWVNATAIHKACGAHPNGITRAHVRAFIPEVTLTKGQGLLGFSVGFLARNIGAAQGPGDLGGHARFGIYKIQAGGVYKSVG